MKLVGCMIGLQKRELKRAGEQIAQQNQKLAQAEEQIAQQQENLAQAKQQIADQQEELERAEAGDEGVGEALAAVASEFWIRHLRGCREVCPMI